MTIHLKSAWFNYRSTWLIVIQLSVASCGIPNELDIPDTDCLDDLESNISIKEIKELASASVFQVSEDWILTGYITSSDQAGNFFNTLYLQEGFYKGASGIQVQIELRDSYLRFPVGSEVYIKLKGLYVGMSNDLLKIGSAMTNFGSLAVSRIPALKINNHVIRSCDGMNPEQIAAETLASLQPEQIGTLIALDQLEFKDDMLGLTYAEVREDTYRKLTDCIGNTILLSNSGYSSFQAAILPNGNGTINGILLKKGKDYMLKIRDTNDILFDYDRCSQLFPLITSEQVFFSEIADPDNNSQARFIELFNSSDEELILDGWSIERYTNASNSPNSSFDLSGSAIGPKATLLIASNDSVFQSVYNFPPDLIAGTNSVADSNGDDNLVLLDPFQSVIDQFGIPGEDGSSTNHEFEDGGAFRKTSINKGNPEFLFDEWIIYNDTGAEGTILKELNAPEDYSPGRR